MNSHSVQKSIRSRIYWAFRTLNGLMLGLAAIGVAALMIVSHSAQRAVEAGARLNEIRLELRAESLLASRVERDYLLSEEGEGVRRNRGSYALQLRAVVHRMKELAAEGESLASAPADRQRFLAMGAQASEVGSAVGTLVAGSGAEPRRRARVVLTQMEKLTTEAARSGTQESAQALATVKRTTRDAIGVEVLLSLAALAACLYFGTRLARHIMVPVESLTALASRVSLGDLSVKVERTSEDEIGDLQESLARLVVAVRFFQVESQDTAPELDQPAALSS